jgi:hypothetical protein
MRGERITIVTMAIMTNQNQKSQKKMEDWLEYHLLVDSLNLFDKENKTK